MVTLGQAAPQGAALQPQGILQTLLGGVGEGGRLCFTGGSWFGASAS